MKVASSFINYYASSLTDGDIQTITKAELEKSIYLQSPIISENKAALALFYKQNVKYKDQKSISVCIAPLFVSIKIKRGEHITLIRTYPYWIPAILTQNGELLPPKNGELPWFIREVLEPYIQSQNEMPCIGHVETVNTKLNLASFDYSNWDAYWKCCEDFFQIITTHSFDSFCLDECEVVQQLNIVAVTPNTLTKGIGNLYKSLKSTILQPNLVTEVLENVSRDQQVITNNEELFLEAGHYGQYSNQFPLSFSQRQALHYFIKDQKETKASVLAVNGPPGTGKTTLLQSVVANQMVCHVLEDKSAPKIVATSANNQAITNILDSFESNSSLERWLPKLNSLGTYLTNSDKNPKNYQIIGKGKEGYNGSYLTDFEQNNSFELKAYYLDKFNAHFTAEFSDIEACTAFLQKKIKTNKKHIDTALACYKNTIDFKSTSFDLDRIEDQVVKLEKLHESITDTKTKEANLKALYRNEFEVYFKENELSFIQKMLKSKRAKTDLQIAGYLATCPIVEVNECTEYETAQAIIIKLLNEYRALIKKQTKESTELSEQLKKAYQLIAIKQQVEQQLDEYWFSYIETKSIKEKELYASIRNNGSLFEQVNTILDLTLRYESFTLSLHYWEAKWINLHEEATFTNNKGLRALDNLFTRLSHLTPLFVSTLYTLPSFCKYYQFNDDKSGEELFAYNRFDLLLVDEAGQVTPEIGLPSFCFSNHALVLGDIHQIEPIWRINYSRIDKANLEESGVLKQHTYETLVQKNITCVSGSLMHLAQHASRVKLSIGLGGTMLTEHRRCVDNLVAYSNEYIYKGLLKPMVGKIAYNQFEFQNDNLTIPPFAYINVLGKSDKTSGSLSNVAEAIAISQWIKHYEPYLQNFYKGKSIEQIVAVVTPFKGQQRLIKSNLEKLNLSTDIIVGTVHALQGSEIPIVLFSPTYGTNHKGDSYFFDRGFNMLNVAITRAKHHFIVIGNMRVFKASNANLPSNALANYLYQQAENELPSAFLYDTLSTKSLQRVATLEKHQSCITKILLDAKERVIIISPFISNYAIEHDEIIAKIMELKAKKPKAKIIVYTDHDLDRHNGELKASSKKGRELLLQAGVELKILKGIHNKAIIMDNHVLIEGSFNWLSALRDKKNRYFRHEVSQIILEDEATKQIKQLLTELELIPEIVSD